MDIWHDELSQRIRRQCEALKLPFEIDDNDGSLFISQPNVLEGLDEGDPQIAMKTYVVCASAYLNLAQEAVRWENNPTDALK